MKQIELYVRFNFSVPDDTPLDDDRLHLDLPHLSKIRLMDNFAVIPATINEYETMEVTQPE